MSEAFGDNAGPESKVSFRNWPYLTGFSLLSYDVLTILRSYQRLRHIRGPTIAAFTNWWWIKAAVSGKGHLALPEVSTNHGKAGEVMLLYKDDVTDYKSRLYRTNWSRHSCHM